MLVEGCNQCPSMFTTLHPCLEKMLQRVTNKIAWHSHHYSGTGHISPDFTVLCFIINWRDTIPCKSLGSARACVRIRLSCVCFCVDIEMGISRNALSYLFIGFPWQIIDLCLGWGAPWLIYRCGDGLTNLSWNIFHCDYRNTGKSYLINIHRLRVSQFPPLI